MEFGQTFDSREVIERINELVDAKDSGVDWTTDDAQELDMLQDFAEEASGYVPDWKYGEIFINADYFEDYARELAEDLGIVNSDAEWPNNHIDWEAAADELLIEYTSFEIDGQTYYAR